MAEQSLRNGSSAFRGGIRWIPGEGSARHRCTHWVSLRNARSDSWNLLPGRP